MSRASREGNSNLTRKSPSSHSCATPLAEELQIGLAGGCEEQQVSVVDLEKYNGREDSSSSSFSSSSSSSSSSSEEDEEEDVTLVCQCFTKVRTSLTASSRRRQQQQLFHSSERSADRTAASDDYHKTTESPISPLMGKVFLRDDETKAGNESFHFDEQLGCYISWENTDYELDDGTPLPPRLFLTEPRFDPETSTFSGRTDFGGAWGGMVAQYYYMRFDTEYLCVLSGNTVFYDEDGETETSDCDEYGVSCCYTCRDLDESVVGEDMLKRLKDEGATEKSLEPFLALIQKKETQQKSTEVELTKKRKQNFTKLLRKKYAAKDYIYSTFEELTEGFFFKTHWIMNEEGIYTSTHQKTTEWIDMSQPRPCSYQKYDKNQKKIVTIPLHNTWDTISTTSPPPVEYRGITLNQLLAVTANIIRRCESERWTNHRNEPLTPDKVTLYDADRYIIRPFTKDRQLSFVTCLPSTAGAQPPRFFVSHWWGEAVVDFARCISQLIRDFGRNESDEDDLRGGGLTADTPLWICAYSNNQWRLGDDITVDPKQSGFYRAMLVAEGRTVTILDKGGVVFSRIWCSFELFLSIDHDNHKNPEKEKTEEGNNEKKSSTKKNGLWVVYTAHPHKFKSWGGAKGEKRDALGIIPGGAPCDQGHAYRTAARQYEFPFGLIRQSLGIRVEEAEASEEVDRIHILNSIIGHGGKYLEEDINDTPPTKHEKYNEVNDAVTAVFISTRASIKAMSKENDDVWNSFLLAFSKGRKELDIYLKFGDYGWSSLTADRATQLINHLPTTTVRLVIREANFGVGFVDAVINYVCKSSMLNELRLYDINIGAEKDGQETADRLADAVLSNSSITMLGLRFTDLLGRRNMDKWGVALMENKTIEVLGLRGMEDEVVKTLREATKGREPELDIYSR